MGYIKVLKNKAYSMRYQTKFRRRREGKTDYYARKRLVFQEKDKYDARKYRFVVRRTNKRILCQVIYSTLTGDKCMCAADSLELKNHGVQAGLTNYAAAYATGLLCARRLLASKKMDTMFAGNKKIDGSHYCSGEQDNERRPFKAFLDVGLVRTTTGNRVFGAMKGACDGGLNIPHKDKRFPGFHIIKAEIVVGKRGKAAEVEKAKQTFDPKEHREHIFGQHVEKYYKDLQANNQQRFKAQFSQWEKHHKGADFAKLYEACHASIRKNPARKVSASKGTHSVQKSHVGYNIMKSNKGKTWISYRRLSHAERKDRVAKKMLLIQQAAME